MVRALQNANITGTAGNTARGDAQLFTSGTPSVRTVASLHSLDSGITLVLNYNPLPSASFYGAGEWYIRRYGASTETYEPPANKLTGEACTP